MKLGISVLFFLFVLLACHQSVPTKPRPDDNSFYIWVDADYTDCLFKGPRKCYKIKKDSTKFWEHYPYEIEKFHFETGFVYKLKVHEIKNLDTGKMQPIYKWELIKVESKIPRKAANQMK